MTLGLLACASSAEAQTTPAERQLVEYVAKVSFNEALDSYHDLALIWQIVEAKGATPHERIFWLRAHSRCVTGVLSQDVAYSRPGNCHWTRNLLPNDRRPRGFIDCHDTDHDGEVDGPCDGSWPRLRDRWVAHVAATRAFVMGEDTYRPCAETPDSWDGVRYGRERVAPESSRRRILECRAPYVTSPGEEGLHNFAVVFGTGSS